MEFTGYYVLLMRDKSVLVKPNGADNKEGVWLPISKVEVTHGELEKGEIIDFEIPEWLAIDREMV